MQLRKTTVVRILQTRDPVISETDIFSQLTVAISIPNWDIFPRFCLNLHVKTQDATYCRKSSVT
jgi:hypothetical protein